MSPVQYFNFSEKFQLESGNHVSGFQLAYQTFGKLNSEKDNVVWIIHALTGNSDPTVWWSGIVGKDRVINPEKHFIVCANCLGSHYGSTSPLSINNENGIPYFHHFPILTNKDVVCAFDLLRQYLQIDKIKLLVGASLGGQQALEWAIQHPEIITSLCPIGTNARHSAWGIAFNESQRMAIETDPSWKEHHPNAGKEGMKVARSVALLSYRTSKGYNLSQTDMEEKIDHYKVTGYQRYQGEKIASRFNAFSYWYMTKMMDSHNVGRKRSSIENALSQITSRTTVIGIDSDLLFPLEEQEFLVRHIHQATLKTIKSHFGHDGFLTESDKVSEILSEILV